MRTIFLPVWATWILFPLLLLISCKEDLENTKMGSPKTYLFVHGANHGGWAWKKVVPLLQAQGHRVEAIDLPGHGDDRTPPEKVTLDDYVRKVVDVVSARPGPVILVGHSAGGVTIAQAAERLGASKVEKLIFLDAFLPKSGESVFSLAAKLLPPSTTGESTFEGSFIFDQNQATFRLDTARVAHFLYRDCSASDISFAKANLGKQPVAPFATPIQGTDAVYGTIPKHYIIFSEARNANMSQMAGNVTVEKTVTLSTGHSPFFSRPEGLIDLIVSF
jgi:pimeloyl-ACP methyl ester carboxylesterase